MQCTVKYINSKNFTIVLGTTYRGQEYWCASWYKFSQLATTTSGFSLLYSTVYNTVHSALLSGVISTEWVCVGVLHSLGGN